MGKQVFKVGDLVWCKDLVTNESYQVKVLSVRDLSFEDGSSATLYLTSDGPSCVILGKVSAGDIFETKEECDAVPRYLPESGPVCVEGFTEEDYKRLDQIRNGKIND